MNIIKVIKNIPGDILYSLSRWAGNVMIDFLDSCVKGDEGE